MFKILVTAAAAYGVYKLYNYDVSTGSSGTVRPVHGPYSAFARYRMSDFADPHNAPLYTVPRSHGTPAVESVPMYRQKYSPY